MGIGARTSSLKTIEGPGLRSPPRSTRLQTGNEEVEFGVARPPEDGLGVSTIRDTARAQTGSAPRGFARNALTALEVVDLMEERHRARYKEKRLHARIPRLEEAIDPI